MAFLKQIPYVRPWKNKEITSFLYKFKTVTCNFGKIIAEENTRSNKVWIVFEGEVELVKRDLATVWWNDKTAVVGLKEVRSCVSKG